MDARIAIPVERGEGLDAVRSEHFGRAAGFAIVDVAGDESVVMGILSNPKHEHGGCMSVVNMLVANSVDIVSASGIGPSPLNGLRQAGIAVHHDPDSKTVGDAVRAVAQGRTSPFGPEHACGGHH